MKYDFRGHIKSLVCCGEVALSFTFKFSDLINYNLDLRSHGQHLFLCYPQFNIFSFK